MIGIGRFFPVTQFSSASRAIKILTLSDTMFFSGMELVTIVFSVFVVQTIPGATLVELGIAHALFYSGVILTEPLFAKFYDSDETGGTSYYGFIIGNIFKSLARFAFIFLSSVSSLYVLFFLLGIIHSIEYPSFAKLFSKNLDKGHEAFEWSYKDSLLSLGKVIATALSGYITVLYGYQTLFAIAATVMFVFGVLVPLVYKQDLIGE